MRVRAATIAMLTLLATVPFLRVQTPRALAFPVATNDATYTSYGRVFPDPHGCHTNPPAPTPPGFSPWAKGRVCAEQFLQYEQVIQGLQFMQGRHPRFLQFVDLQEELGDAYQTAGLPQPDLSRLKSPLVALKVTDTESDIPEAERRHFIYSMSIHGIERAGIEGGIRAIEDLVTWSACEADPASAPACAEEGPFPKQILEPFDEDPAAFDADAGPYASQVTREGVVYFILSNPDGWRRGSLTEGGVFFQRYNGNGMDINRDWASLGYTEAQYTPFSEPETVGFSNYLRSVRDETAAGRFIGGIDLHGMVTSNSFSFTLLGAGQRDYAKNAQSVDTGIRTWRDSEERLTWSDLVESQENGCPGDVPEPFFGRTQGPMCTDQWGTVWDTIRYQVTGSAGDWIDSPLGLNAIGMNNEMALSHLAPNNAFVPEVEQLHVDGNKGLIYSQIASLLEPQESEYVPGGKIGYVFDPDRIRNAGGEEATPPTAGLPQQDKIEVTRPNGMSTPYEFENQNVKDGVYNGGIDIRITTANANGVSPGAEVDWILDYCGPALGADDPYDNECREVARYFNQASTYLQGGAQIVLNDPPPGPFQIRGEYEGGDWPFPTDIEINFTEGKAYPVPNQAPYDASRMDFFEELNEYVDPRSELEPVRVADIVADPSILDRYDSVVVTEEFLPTGDQVAPYAAALRGFAERGGNVVLTDGAMQGLPRLVNGIENDHVRRGFFYAGYIDFNDGENPTYEHDLAKSVNKPGAAEGQETMSGDDFAEADHDDVSYVNRHQTFEPGPIGYYISVEGAGNSICDSDKCDSPNWVVDTAAWADAGGEIVGRTYARETTEADSPGFDGVSLGQVKLGKGTIRIVGALLPNPTEENYHPFGLSSYAVTYTGYQLFANATKWDNPARVVGPGPGSVDGALRLSGPTRIETAIDISQDSFTDDTAGAVVLARADAHPDALAGTPLALAKDASMLLTYPNELHHATADEIDRLLEPGATVYLLGGESALSPAVADAVEDRGMKVERISGPTRIETAVAIARELGDPDTALIATGDDFADALAGGAAAGHVGGAILLTTPNAPHPATTAYLDEHGPTAYAIGGPAARAYPDATPIAGDSREETAVAVAERFFEAPTHVGIARRDVFADALTGGVHTARQGGPMLVTFTDRLHKAPAGYLCQHADEIAFATIYGGEAAIQASVMAAVGQATLGAGC